MTNLPSGIPTVYKNVRMRSRLEAKWAYMFDAFGWQWEYEPCEFKGWIPDFYIRTGLQNFFVEIKPTNNLKNEADRVNSIITNDENYDTAIETLVLGISPFSEIPFLSRNVPYVDIENYNNIFCNSCLGVSIYRGSLADEYMFYDCQLIKEIFNPEKSAYFLLGIEPDNLGYGTTDFLSQTSDYIHSFIQSFQREDGQLVHYSHSANDIRLYKQKLQLIWAEATNYVQYRREKVERVLMLEPSQQPVINQQNLTQELPEPQELQVTQSSKKNSKVA